MSEQVEPEPEQDGTGPTKLAPALDCHCGAVPTSVIEAILLDPRNRSHQYWRERHAELIIHSHANLQVSLSIQNRPEDTLPAGWERERDELSGSHYYVNPMTGELRLEPPPAESWSREVELLGRSFTPQNMYDTARLRVAIAENLEIRKELERLEEARNEVLSPAEMALAELRMQVIDALDRGGSIRCPRCGVRAIKDDVRCALQCCLCVSAPLFPHFLVLASLASVSLANVRYHISKRRDFLVSASPIRPAYTWTPAIVGADGASCAQKRIVQGVVAAVTRPATFWSCILAGAPLPSPTPARHRRLQHSKSSSGGDRPLW